MVSGWLCDRRGSCLHIWTDADRLWNICGWGAKYHTARGGQSKKAHDLTTAASDPRDPRAVEIAHTLKEWIKSGKFLLTEMVAPLPGVESGVVIKPLQERPI